MHVAWPSARCCTNAESIARCYTGFPAGILVWERSSSRPLVKSKAGNSVMRGLSLTLTLNQFRCRATCLRVDINAPRHTETFVSRNVNIERGFASLSLMRSTALTRNASNTLYSGAVGRYPESHVLHLYTLEDHNEKMMVLEFEY